MAEAKSEMQPLDAVFFVVPAEKLEAVGVWVFASDEMGDRPSTLDVLEAAVPSEEKNTHPVGKPLACLREKGGEGS